MQGVTLGVELNCYFKKVYNERWGEVVYNEREGEVVKTNLGYNRINLTKKGLIRKVLFRVIRIVRKVKLIFYDFKTLRK